MATPELIIIAGPNGCGKTTLSDFLLGSRKTSVFINADVIARGLSPAESSPGELQAGRVMLDRLHRALDNQESVSFETTLSGRSWMKLIKKAKSQGYLVCILYVLVSDADLAVERIAKRVEEGGHDVPEPVVRRRFTRSKQMFYNIYSKLTDMWYIFDNTERPAKLVARKENGGSEILHEEIFKGHFG